MILAIFAVLLLVLFVALIVDWGVHAGVRADETQNKKEAWFCICLGLTFGLIVPMMFCLAYNI